MLLFSALCMSCFVCVSLLQPLSSLFCFVLFHGCVVLVDVAEFGKSNIARTTQECSSASPCTPSSLQCATSSSFVHCGCTGITGRVEALDLSGMNPAVTRLALTDNNITSLGSNCTQGGGAVETITVAHNKLDAVPGASFANLPKLHTVDYSNNRIAHINASAVHCAAHYPALRRMSLLGNELEYVHEHAVVECGQLTSFEQGGRPAHCPAGSYLQLQHLSNHNSNSTSTSSQASQTNRTSSELLASVRICKCEVGKECVEESVKSW